MEREEISGNDEIFEHLSSTLGAGVRYEGEDDISYDDIMDDNNEYVNANEFVKDGVLELVLGLRVRTSGFSY